MRIKILMLIGMFCFSSTVLGQEIGSVVNGIHSVTLLKSDNYYACVYSDSNSEVNSHKSFNFPIKETVYKILMDGFSTFSNHQVFVQIDEQTIVKFEYKIINGELKLKINHNNLIEKTIGSSTYLTKNQVMSLFGMSTSYG